MFCYDAFGQESRAGPWMSCHPNRCCRILAVRDCILTALALGLTQLPVTLVWFTKPAKNSPEKER